MTTPEFAKQFREEALLKYEKEKEEVGFQMMLMGYYKIKSNLSENGLRKVFEIDSRREKDENFNRELSKLIWEVKEYVWEQALDQLMMKISDAYGLKIGEDLRVEILDDDELSLDLYV